MEINNIDDQKPFTTADGSTIRSILDTTNSGVENQSLAEACLPPGAQTDRHYHKLSEEIYYILEGEGIMEIDNDTRPIKPGDGILIPPGAWHQITSGEKTLNFLCCCAPAYSHGDTYFQ